MRRVGITELNKRGDTGKNEIHKGGGREHARIGRIMEKPAEEKRNRERKRERGDLNERVAIDRQFDESARFRKICRRFFENSPQPELLIYPWSW